MDPNIADGTSGSLWLDMDKRPAGVLYVGSEEVTCINPIKAVQEALKQRSIFEYFYSNFYLLRDFT